MVLWCPGESSGPRVAVWDVRGAALVLPRLPRPRGAAAAGVLPAAGLVVHRRRRRRRRRRATAVAVVLVGVEGEPPEPVFAAPCLVFQKFRTPPADPRWEDVVGSLGNRLCWP